MDVALEKWYAASPVAPLRGPALVRIASLIECSDQVLIMSNG
jgi:hypothetical protein